MSQDSTTVLALRNAWNGAIAAADRLRELTATLDALSKDGSLTGADLEPLRAAALAQAIAAQALRGLLEELHRKTAGAEQP